MSISDDYHDLGLNIGASPKMVRDEYLYRAKKCHPDLFPNNPAKAEEFSRLNRTYHRAYSDALERRCEHCKGEGSIIVKVGFRSTRMICSACNGSKKAHAR